MSRSSGTRPGPLTGSPTRLGRSCVSSRRPPTSRIRRSTSPSTARRLWNHQPPTRERLMIDDAVVFDGVAHIFNFDEDNAYDSAGQMFSNHLYAFHATLTPDGQTVLPPEQFLHKWSIDEIREMVYDQSATDMLVAMPLPLTDLYKDGLSPWEDCSQPAQRDPDRTASW